MELRDLREPDTILDVSEHAFMIVGLKYVGEADDLPTRVAVGEMVKLCREPCGQPDPEAVTAFYNGRKVGYLSPEKQALWDSLGPARDRAKVTGEILDEDGDLAGLDIQIDVECDERPPVAGAAAAAKSMRNKRRGIVFGFAVLCLILTAGADSTDPAIPAIGTRTPDPLALSSAERMQAQELSRMVQRENAHRLANELRRRAEVALGLQQAEAHKTRQLAEDLRQARALAAQQRIRIEELERRTLAIAAHWQAENHKLEGLNREELLRRKNQAAAWTARRSTPATKKTRSAVRQAPEEKTSAPSLLPNETTIRKKTNFSRYAQENRDLDGQQPERFAR
jgi:hypothetical protein